MQQNRFSLIKDHGWVRTNSQKNPITCVLILAGGEGKRLRPFVHLLRRDMLPKQYVNFIGRRSMLDHTFDRAEKMTDRRHVYTVINKSHLSFPEVRRQIGTRVAETVIIQPENKETAAGLLLGLSRIAKDQPNSIVTILPSDHFVLEEDELINHLKVARQLIKREPSLLALLGIEPDRHESEYGYIIPGRRLKRGSAPFYTIASFVEKPDHETAQKLARERAFWNTMMMVAKTRTLLELMRPMSPALFDAFQPVFNTLGTPIEAAVIEEVYQNLPAVNFSKDILEPMVRAHPSKVATLPVRSVLWSDWGSECRVMEVLRKTGNASRLNGLAHPPHFGSELNFAPRSTPPADARTGKRPASVLEQSLF